jgi:DNA-binding transcriptional LysR family regulator
MDDLTLGIRPRQLAQFVTLIDSGDFELAADALQTTPRALAKALRQLERCVGEPLLTPSVQHVALTPTGELMAESARRVLLAVDRFAEIAQAGRSALHVAHVPSTDTMSKVLTHALTRHRWLHVREHAVPDHRQLQHLRDHRLDVAICVTRDCLPNEFDACLLRLDPLVVATAGIHACTAPVDPRESPLYVPTYGSAWPMHDAVIDEYARATGCRLTRVAVPAGSGQETAAVLREARGRRALVASSALGDSDVVTAPLTPRQPYLTWSLVWRRGDASSEVQAFVSEARELSERCHWLDLVAAGGAPWLRGTD